MTSKSSTIATVAALGLLLAVGATTSAYAWGKTFTGTRDQVRAACAAVGGDLWESSGHTACFNYKNGTSVGCDDNNQCGGEGPGPSPRTASFGQFIDLAIGGVAVKAAPSGVPESLTSGSGGGGDSGGSGLSGAGSPGGGHIGMPSGGDLSTGGQIFSSGGGGQTFSSN